MNLKSIINFHAGILLGARSFTFCSPIIPLSVCLFLFVNTATRGSTHVLKTSWSGLASIQNDQITFKIRIHSLPGVSTGGGYVLNYLGANTFNVDGGTGKMTLDTYAGAGAVVSNDGLTVTFTSIFTSPNYIEEFDNPQTSMFPVGGNSYVYNCNLIYPPDGYVRQLEPEIINCYLYSDFFYYLYGTWYALTNGRSPFDQVVNVDINLYPNPDLSPPHCNPGCSSCGGSPKMASYSLDPLRGTLRLVDTPVTYQPPLGPSVFFTTTYNQANLGELSTPLFSNLGPQFTYNWLTYINGDPDVDPNSVTRYAPDGGLEYYPNYLPGAPYHGPDGNGGYTYFGAFAPERDTRAILSWDPQHRRYTRTLPDGAYVHFLQYLLIFILQGRTQFENRLASAPVLLPFRVRHKWRRLHRRWYCLV